MPGKDGTELFCEALKHDVDPDGTITDRLTIPLAADLKDGYDLALSKIVAALIGLDPKDVFNRKKLFDSRRNKIYIVITSIFLLTFIISGYFLYELFSNFEYIKYMMKDRLYKFLKYQPSDEEINSAWKKLIVPNDGWSTKTCASYMERIDNITHNRSVACNHNTGIGYYWALSSPPIRNFGRWGINGTGPTPSCNSTADVGKYAEAGSNSSDLYAMDVRHYWCRNTSATIKCTGRFDEGDPAETDERLDGVLLATCQAQDDR
jgi:hypothetical protein